MKYEIELELGKTTTFEGEVVCALNCRKCGSDFVLVAGIKNERDRDAIHALLIRFVADKAESLCSDCNPYSFKNYAKEYLGKMTQTERMGYLNKFFK